MALAYFEERVPMYLYDYTRSCHRRVVYRQLQYQRRCRCVAYSEGVLNLFLEAGHVTELKLQSVEAFIHLSEASQLVFWAYSQEAK